MGAPSPPSPRPPTPQPARRGSARPRLLAATFPARPRLAVGGPLPRRGHVAARGAWRPRLTPPPAWRAPARAPRTAAPAGRAPAGARPAPPPASRARPRPRARAPSIPASPARPSSRAPPAPYIHRPAEGAQSAAAAAAPRYRCWQRPPPRQPRGRASPGSKPAFSPRVSACVCASRPVGPRPGGAATLLPRRCPRAGPRAGIWGLGPRPSGPGWGLRARRPRGPLPCPPAGACLSLPSVFGLSSPGWRVEGTGSAWRWRQREGGGDSPHFPLRNGGEWGPSVRGPGAFCPGMEGNGGGARWGPPFFSLDEDS